MINKRTRDVDVSIKINRTQTQPRLTSGFRRSYLFVIIHIFIACIQYFYGSCEECRCLRAFFGCIFSLLHWKVLPSSDPVSLFFSINPSFHQSVSSMRSLFFSRNVFKQLIAIEGGQNTNVFDLVDWIFWTVSKNWLLFNETFPTSVFHISNASSMQAFQFGKYAFYL